MIWNEFADVQVTNSWQFTPIVEGCYFRLRHNSAPNIPIGWIAQAEQLSDGSYQIYEPRRLNALSLYEIVFLPMPPFFSNRRIGFRQQTRYNNSWTIEIEVNDMPLYPITTDPTTPFQSTSFISSTPTINTTTSKILSANPARKQATFYNPDIKNAVYLDVVPTLTVNNAAFIIPPGNVYVSDLAWSGDVYAVTKSGSVVMSVREFI